MIDLYTWTAPNGHKVYIRLQETGLEYTAHPINSGIGIADRPRQLSADSATWL